MQYGVIQVQGIAQLFMKQNVERKIILIIVKCVDEVLLDVHPEDIRQFHESIARRFKEVRFIEGPSNIFDSVHVPQEEVNSICATMK